MEITTHNKSFLEYSEGISTVRHALFLPTRIKFMWSLYLILLNIYIDKYDMRSLKVKIILKNPGEIIQIKWDRNEYMQKTISCTTFHRNQKKEKNLTFNL